MDVAVDQIPWPEAVHKSPQCLESAVAEILPVMNALEDMRDYSRTGATSQHSAIEVLFEEIRIFELYEEEYGWDETDLEPILKRVFSFCEKWLADNPVPEY